MEENTQAQENLENQNIKPETKSFKRIGLIFLIIIQFILAAIFIYISYGLKVSHFCVPGGFCDKGEVNTTILLIKILFVALGLLSLISSMGLTLKKKWGKLLSISFWILLLILGGYLIFKYTTQVDQPIKEESVSFEEPTANWKTYRNEEFGFEVKYQNDLCINKGWVYNDYYVVDIQRNCPPLQEAGTQNFTLETSIIIRQDFKYTTLENYIDKFVTIGGFGKWSKEKVFVNGLPAYKVHHDCEGIEGLCYGGTSWIINKPNTNLIFEISTGSQLTLSTFKFIEPTSKSDWKIYRNTKYDYSINYPPTFTIFTDTNQQKQEVIPPTSDSQKVSLTNNKEFLFCCEALITSVQVINGPIDTKNWGQYAIIPDYRIKSQGEIIFAGRKAFQVRASVGIDSAGARLVLISENPFSYVIIQGDIGQPWEQITNSFRLE